MDTDSHSEEIAQESLKFDAAGYKRLVANSNFRKLWRAQFVSSMGDWFIIGILIPTVLALSGGKSSAVAAILVVKIIPALLLSSFTGVFVDYFDRRKIMITSDIVRLVLVLTLLTTNSLTAIYLVVFLMETASLFFWPARNALIPAISGKKDLPLANSLMYTTQQAAMVVGLVASGAILAGFESLLSFVINFNFPEIVAPVVAPFVAALTPILVGSKAGFLLDSFTFSFSSINLSRMKGIDSCPPRDESKRLSFSTVGQGAKESFQFLTGHTELRGLLVTMFFAIVGGGALVPVGLDYIATLTGSVPLANEVEWIAQFAGSRQTFIMANMAIGMVTGALLIPRIEKRINVRFLFPVSVAIFGIGMLGFALTGSYFVTSLYAVGAGACIASVTVAGNNYIATQVSDSIRGRVFTALESVIRVSLLLSMIVVAPLSDFLSAIIRGFLNKAGITHIFGLQLSGARVTLILAAAVVLAAAVYGFRHLFFSEEDRWIIKGEDNNEAN